MSHSQLKITRKLYKLGNSQAVVLPKFFIIYAGLQDGAVLEAANGKLIITKPEEARPR